MLQYAVKNVKRQMGALSPFTLLPIPIFPVLLQNRGRSQAANVGFDTGLSNAHVQISSALAASLGIIPTGSENRSDATQNFVAQTGVIDKVTATGAVGCSVSNAKVLFFQDAPFLIGNDFIRDAGLEFTYENGVPSMKCTPVTKSMQTTKSPIFMVSMTQKGKTQNASAFFDTGWEGSDIAVPASIAQQLGLPALRTTTAKTHTGTVTLIKSKMDRLGMQEIPACYVNGADVDILPASSPIQRIIVGEGFYKKVNGSIGYDSQGAFFSCPASGNAVARAIGEGILPSDFFPIDRLAQMDPLLLGGMVFVGLGILGALVLFATRD